MRIELNEVVWLEAETLSFDELLERSGLPASLLRELVHAGGIEPLDRSAPQPAYGARALVAARRARRLHQDFELDAAALLLVLDLLDRVAELEGRLNELQVKLPRRLP
jgi:chaperone modulatory protein CbpM